MCSFVLCIWSLHVIPIDLDGCIAAIDPKIHTLSLNEHLVLISKIKFSVSFQFYTMKKSLPF